LNGFGAALLVLLVAGSAFALNDSRRCSLGKLKGMTKAFQCLIKDDRNVLSGMASHPERCAEKLQSLFEHLESYGSCPTTGDHEITFDVVRDAEQALEPAIFIANSAAPDPETCTSIHLNLASRYVTCMAGTRVHGIETGYISSEIYPDIDFPCAGGLAGNLERQTLVKGCAGEIPGLTEALRGFYSYLPGIDLHSLAIEKDFFLSASLVGADLSNALIKESDFRGADLSYANLDGIRGYRNYMDGANLTGVDMTTARLEAFRMVNLAGCPAVLPAEWHCVKNNVVGPTAWLGGADLAGADLSGLNLSNASFFSADLTGADLGGADVGGVWGSTICPDGTNAANHSYTCCGHHVGVPPHSCAAY
jgi:hypothetical protein